MREDGSFSWNTKINITKQFNYKIYGGPILNGRISCCTKQQVLLAVCAIVLPAFLQISHAALVYTDPTDGELSENETAPTPIGTLDLGVNTISGTNLFSIDAGDVFEVIVPNGLQLTTVSLDISNYDNIGGTGVSSFFISSPFSRFDQKTFTSDGLIAYINGLPVGPGTYAFSTQYSSLGGNESYDWEWTLETAAVPVPAALYLFGSGLLGLIGIARKKAA